MANQMQGKVCVITGGAEKNLSGLLGCDASQFFNEITLLKRHVRGEEVARAVLPRLRRFALHHRQPVDGRWRIERLGPGH